MESLAIMALVGVIGVLVTFGVFFAKGWFSSTDTKFNKVFEKIDDVRDKNDTSVRRFHTRMDDLITTMGKRMSDIEKEQAVQEAICKLRHPGTVAGGGSTTPRVGAPHEDGGGI